MEDKTEEQQVQEEIKYKLSILMPTIPERSNTFEVLFNEVNRQKEKVEKQRLGNVELIVDCSNRFLDGGKSIGEKRDFLVQSAMGEYLCFLDDDDGIFPNYLEEILKMTRTEKDAYTFNQLFVSDSYVATIQMSFDNKENEQAISKGIVKRTIWHTCPIRSSIAKTERFVNKNYDEDWDWLKRILPKIQTSDHLDVILHQYNEIRGGSEAVKIFGHGYK